MLAAGVVVLATGLRAAPFAASVPGPRDHAGRAEVDEYLRVPVAPEIFVAGDAAHAETGTGHLTCLDLGRSAAVLTEGWDRNAVLQGAEAKQRKNFINNELIYPPSATDPAALLAASVYTPN